ncbi:DUF1883 domain-containing protein [Streptomyces sp. QTS137]
MLYRASPRRARGPPVQRLGNLKKGSRVIVAVRNKANVHVMTRSAYSSYKSGKRYRALGGSATRSRSPL